MSSFDYNQVVLVGNVGSDPEVLKKTEKGTFVRFSIATNQQYTNRQGETVKTVHWHQVEANNGVGTLIANHLKKGTRVFVSGELHHSEWTDKRNQTRTKIFIAAQSVYFLSSLDKSQPLKEETDDHQEDSEGGEPFGEE